MFKFIYNVEKRAQWYATSRPSWKQRVAWFMGRSVRNATILASFVVVGYVLAKVYNATHPKYMQAAPITIDLSSELFNQKMDIIKDKVVSQIKFCESNGHTESDGLVTYDPKTGETVASKIPSFGLFQFKQATVVYYYKLLYGEVITPKDAIIIALDEKKAAKLAKDIMFKTKGMASGDWITCAHSLDTDKQISVIKNLEK